jgi:DNA-binding NarL/FixJ family response regulator
VERAKAVFAPTLGARTSALPRSPLAVAYAVNQINPRAMRIIFADDHFLVRATLKVVLLKLGPRGTVDIDEETDLDGVLSKARVSPPDLVVLDLSMPGMRGPESLKAVRELLPTTPLVILSGYADHDTILACFKWGATGFIPKTMGGPEMLAALRLVLAGQRYVPPAFLEQELGAGAEAAKPHPPEEGTVAFATLLTERERVILKQLAEGKKNKEIGRSLGLEEVTIKFAVRRLYKKMNAVNRAAAVSLATKAGLV